VWTLCQHARRDRCHLFGVDRPVIAEQVFQLVRRVEQVATSSHASGLGSPLHVAAPVSVQRGRQRVARSLRLPLDLVTRLGKKRRDVLLDRLRQRGVRAEQEQHRVLGLVPRSRWPTVGATHEDVVGGRAEPRTAALVAVLSALDLAHKVIDLKGLSKREVRKRAKQVADGDWTAKAVRHRGGSRWSHRRRRRLWINAATARRRGRRVSVEAPITAGATVGRDDVKQGAGCLIWILATTAAVWAFAETQQGTGLMLLAIAGIGILVVLQ
jgi:hypothetical protein